MQSAIVMCASLLEKADQRWTDFPVRSGRVFLTIKHAPVEFISVCTLEDERAFEGEVVVTSGMRIWAL